MQSIVKSSASEAHCASAHSRRPSVDNFIGSNCVGMFFSFFSFIYMFSFFGLGLGLMYLFECVYMYRPRSRASLDLVARFNGATAGDV